MCKEQMAMKVEQARKSSEDTQAAGQVSAWKSLGSQKLRLEKV